MRNIKLLILLAISTVITACDQEYQANRGFKLPQGFAENGKLLFKEFHCVQCHTISGTEFAGGEWRATKNVGISVELGGEKSQVQTYGDLVTSIINPSHRIAKGYSRSQVVDEGETPNQDESKMPVYNSIMTVEDLVDIVTFLETQYTLKNLPETEYPYFNYPIIVDPR